MFAEWVTALGTVGVAVAAWWQLPLIAEQVRSLAAQIHETRTAEDRARQRHREWETLRACERYDYDPVLEEVTKRIHLSSTEGANYTNPGVAKRDLICLLNYFDGLAIGIRQGLYIEQIVKDHLGMMVAKSVTAFIESGLIEKTGYEVLVELHERWANERAKPGYQPPPS